MKILPVGAEWFRAGRMYSRTVMTESIITSRNFPNASKNLLK